MKNALIILVLIISTETFAQSFIINAGLNFSNMVIQDNSKIYSKDFIMNTGFHAGVTYDYQLSNMITIESGVLLSTRGYKQNETHGAYYLSQNLNLYYLDIPYNWKLYFGKSGTKFYLVSGPYLGLGLAGTRDVEGNLKSSTSPHETTIKWGSESQDDLRRFDFGLNMGAGIQIKTLEIGIMYDLGLSNMAPDTFDYNFYNTKIKNRAIEVSMSCVLNLKKKTEH